MSKEPLDLASPKWDQSTYWGRAQHFIQLTNPMNFLATDRQLDEAKRIVEEYKKTKRMPEGYNADKLWKQKYLADSAFHPDTGEKMISIGRMSAQAPMNTLITSCMIMFYKTKAAVMFWQWMNQNFNAIVNYTNRSGDAVISTHPEKMQNSQDEPEYLELEELLVNERAYERKPSFDTQAQNYKQIVVSYLAACGGAVSTAAFLNHKAKTMNPVFARLVPFFAVGAANFINIPMMRSSELISGTPVFTKDGVRVGDSKIAARTGILLVCFSRIAMAVPSMTLVPLLTNMAVQRNLFCHYPMAVIPFQVSLVCLCATVFTPLACAVFPQKSALNINSAEPSIKEAALKLAPGSKAVYYNKGL